MYKRLVAAGVSVSSAPQKDESGFDGVCWVIFRDPDGILIEINGPAVEADPS